MEGKTYTSEFKRIKSSAIHYLIISMKSKGDSLPTRPTWTFAGHQHNAAWTKRDNDNYKIQVIVTSLAPSTTVWFFQWSDEFGISDDLAPVYNRYFEHNDYSTSAKWLNSHICDDPNNDKIFMYDHNYSTSHLLFIVNNNPCIYKSKKQSERDLIWKSVFNHMQSYNFNLFWLFYNMQ